MATEIRRRRGSTADHSTFTGAPAELTVDTDKNTIVVHDGATVGGWPVPTNIETLRDVTFTSAMEEDGLVRISGVWTNTSNVTSGLTVPAGTEEERSTTGGFTIRFNTDAGAYEGYNGTAWVGFGAASADLVPYDNTESGLDAENVQGAIDEVQGAIDEAAGRLDDLEDIVFVEEPATVSWNMESDTWTGEPKATAAHKSMRRCVVDNLGVVQYYLDEFDSTLQEDGVTPANLDGTDGQVMVEIKPFYVRTTFNGHVATWSVSPEPMPGYTLHPAFEGGVTKTYVGAYDAIVYDTSASAYIDGLNLDNNTSRVNLGEDLLASVATGNFPMVGLSRNEFRTLADNAGFQLYDFWQWQAVMMLFITEYGSWNSQAVLGRGNVDRSYPSSSSNQASSPHEAPGLSNIIGNGSGGIDDGDGDPWVSYRGIENPWGNSWDLLDGWNIQDRQSYVSNDETVYADDTSAGYSAIGDTMPVASDSAIKNWQFVENVFLVRTVGDGASTSAYVTDHFWTNTGWRSPHVGGAAVSDLRAGLTCCALNGDSVGRSRTLGARLSKKLRS